MYPNDPYFSGPQDPFGGSPFGQFPGGPQPSSGPPVVSAQPEPFVKVNTMATLSLVFAFVFAPAGIVFGHLGLTQIKRRGERGRDRALIGTILSYVFVVVAVAALLAWLISPSDESTHSARKASTSTETTTATATTTRATPAGPPPVPQNQLAGLLLSVDQSKRVANAPNQYTAEDRTTVDGSQGMVVTPPECVPALFSGLESVYSTSNARATVARELNTTTRSGIVGLVERVVMFDNGLTATGQVQQMVGGWRRCAGQTIKVVLNNGSPDRYDVGQVTTAGQSPTIYLVRSTFQNSAPGFANYRALVAKSNVVIDLSMFGYDIGSGPQDIATAILAKIPG